MCDQRILNTYRNQTASQIAASFAAEHGLQTRITPTTTLAGRYYDVDHDEIHCGDFSGATNEWDLLCRLGSQEGITPYVFGDTLFFNPLSENAPIFPISFSRNMAGQLVSNVMALTLERHLTQARDVVVTVRSWNSRKKSSFTATVRTKTKSPSSDSGVSASAYLIVLPNLTQAQCLMKAQQLALDYSQHERTLSATFPSFGFLNAGYVVSLSGTGTDYDMTYYPRAVTYSIDFDGGARTEIFAKFSSELYLYDDDTGQQIGESPDL
jgi:phage protein D